MILDPTKTFKSLQRNYILKISLIIVSLEYELRHYKYDVIMMQEF